MTHAPLVPVLLILAGLAVLALLWRSLDHRGSRAASVRLEQLPAVLEQARRSLAEGAEIRADTVQAIQTALESFTHAFRSRRGVPVMPFLTAERKPTRRRSWM